MVTICSCTIVRSYFSVYDEKVFLILPFMYCVKLSSTTAAAKLDSNLFLMLGIVHVSSLKISKFLSPVLCS